MKPGRWREARWQRQRDTPPSCPAGWSTGPPDFVGVGTHKSGTSWWYQLLARHPGVETRGHPKELDFFFRFDDDDRYPLWFPRRPGRLAGEWTPRYADDLDTPGRLAVVAPEARLLLIVRDPLERYLSDVTMLRSRVEGAEAASLRRGRYATQVANLLRSFPPEQLLLLQYERCVADPRGELARTYRFLGLDDAVLPRWSTRGINVTREEKATVTPARRRELLAAFEPEVDALRAFMPDLDLSLWPSVAHLAG